MAPRDEHQVDFVVFSLPAIGAVLAILGLAIVIAVAACVAVSCTFHGAPADRQPPIVHGSCAPFCAATVSASPVTPGGVR
ncbi:hypothetical protein [Nocardia sp. NPDC051570]|uniref:hypothetical protein n=1 Tax=Nocardia sp. NPDC051570 TaxID=3364324 RepID=UPI0037AAD346